MSFNKDTLKKFEEAVDFLEGLADTLEIEYENHKGAYTEKLRQMTVERQSKW